MIAGALRAARERGRTRALLITNNPAAERAYRAIGFAAHGEVGLVRLDGAVATPRDRHDTCNSQAYGVGSARGPGGTDRNWGDIPGGRPGRLQAGRS